MVAFEMYDLDMTANPDLRICSTDDCGGKHASLGLCAKHYKAHQRKRGMERISDRVCSVDGCGNDHMAKGLCKRHYGDQMPSTECAVDDCTRIARRSDRYCDSHRRRVATGRMDVPIRGVNQTGCLVEVCDGEHYGLGLCYRHWRGGRIDPSKAGGDFREQNLRWKYGITLDERAELFADQGNLCAICMIVEPTDIDHDHSHQCADVLRAADDKRGCRDCVRGGLCARCNITLAVYEGDATRGGSAELLSDPTWCAMAEIHLKQRPFRTDEGR